jgi:hypothetical protein
VCYAQNVGLPTRDKMEYDNSSGDMPCSCSTLSTVLMFFSSLAAARFLSCLGRADDHAWHCNIKSIIILVSSEEVTSDDEVNAQEHSDVSILKVQFDTTLTSLKRDIPLSLFFERLNDGLRTERCKLFFDNLSDRQPLRGHLVIFWLSCFLKAEETTRISSEMVNSSDGGFG